ncbi:MAG TPA: hypothetical protein VGM13_04180 [Thermoanaerobaculia bacterium]|jgi:hypothetical protein
MKIFLILGLLVGARGAKAQALQFYNLAPCRAVDTRFGYGGILAASTVRSFQMKGVCGVAADAQTVTLNVTAVGPWCGGFMVLYPYGSGIPAVSNINFNAGEPAIANAAVVPISAGTPDLSLIYGVGGGTCYSHVVIDVTGYFK